MRGRPRPHSGPARHPMRTGRSAHLGTANALRGARTSSSAFRPGSAPNADREVRAPRHGERPSRCADVLVRIPAWLGAQCGPGGPHTPARRRPFAVRGRPRPHSGLARAQCGPGGPRTRARRPPFVVRGRPRPHSGLARHPMRTGRSAHLGTATALRGARTSSSAFRPGSTSNADREVRAPRYGDRPSRCADVLVRIPAWLAPNADREVRAPRHGERPSRCADVLVRIPAWLGAQCGPGGPRTSARRTPFAVRGRPRPHSGLARRPMRTGRSAHVGTATALRGARTSSSAFRLGSLRQCPVASLQAFRFLLADTAESFDGAAQPRPDEIAT